MEKLVIISGPICSGKSTFMKALKEFECIEVSSIVRSLTQTNSRTPFEHLESAITDRILDTLNKTSSTRVCIGGIRQVGILKAIHEAYPQTQLIWLDADIECLRSRFYNRQDRKDANLSYEEACFSDEKLGLTAVRTYMHEHNCNIIITT